jgi:hypothetical protein
MGSARSLCLHPRRKDLRLKVPPAPDLVRFSAPGEDKFVARRPSHLGSSTTCRPRPVSLAATSACVFQSSRYNERSTPPVDRAAAPVRRKPRPSDHPHAMGGSRISVSCPGNGAWCAGTCRTLGRLRGSVTASHIHRAPKTMGIGEPVGLPGASSLSGIGAASHTCSGMRPPGHVCASIVASSASASWRFTRRKRAVRPFAR